MSETSLSPANRIMHTRATRWTPAIGNALYAIAAGAMAILGWMLVLNGMGWTP